MGISIISKHSFPITDTKETFNQAARWLYCSVSFLSLGQAARIHARMRAVNRNLRALVLTSMLQILIGEMSDQLLTIAQSTKRPTPYAKDPRAKRTAACAWCLRYLMSQLAWTPVTVVPSGEGCVSTWRTRTGGHLIRMLTWPRTFQVSARVNQAYNVVNALGGTVDVSQGFRGKSNGGKPWSLKWYCPPTRAIKTNEPDYDPNRRTRLQIFNQKFYKISKWKYYELKFELYVLNHYFTVCLQRLIISLGIINLRMNIIVVGFQ